MSLDVPAILARAMRLPPRPEPLVACPAGTVCAITGVPLAQGYPAADMYGAATSEFLDTFRGGLHGFVSDAAARLYAVSAPRIKTRLTIRPGGEDVEVSNAQARPMLAFEDGEFWSPSVTAETASKRGGALWRDAVRDVWPRQEGKRCVIILTSDTKQRMWPHARVGALGPRTPVFVDDDKLCSVHSVLWVDWAEMLRCLDLIEPLYSLGYSKPAIRDSLLSSHIALKSGGVAETIARERLVAPWRGRTELTVALIIAQKQEVLSA